MRLVAESLPVLAEISSLAERKAIGPEQAEILRRQVIEGSTKLGEAGAIIPETALRPQTDLRAFAAPEPKLLAAPQTIVTVEPSKPARPPRRKQIRGAVGHK